MQQVGEDTPLYCSKWVLKTWPATFPNAWNYHPVKEGEELSLGKRTLTFMETRMIHWPDSMFTYLKEDRILFSSDGFGQHYAGFEKFDDQADTDLMVQAKKYYANILLLYAPRILKLVDKVVASGIQIDMICPDHGVIWRKDPGKIIDAYFKMEPAGSPIKRRW
jgi:flavorubredoxin